MKQHHTSRTSSKMSHFQKECPPLLLLLLLLLLLPPPT
jgi:hypothetical protein